MTAADKLIEAGYEDVIIFSGDSYELVYLKTEERYTILILWFNGL